MSCYITLKEKGLRLTRPRRLILDYIHERNDHMTAEEIIQHVQKKAPRINKSTVYRTLLMLEKNNCVFTSQTSDRTLYHHSERERHYHLICRKCGKLIDCQEDLFADVAGVLAEKYAFEPELDHFVIYGQCKKCRTINVRKV